MRSSLVVVASLIIGAFAARPFLNEPDTGIKDALGELAVGKLPNITDVVALNDFEWVGRRVLPIVNYTYFRNGAGGEWSYRNNIEVFQRYRFRPRAMVDISNVSSTLSTSILGYNFSNPFFISPCGSAGYAHPDAELNLAKGAGSQGILYIYSTKKLEEIAAVKLDNQTMFAQVYASNNDTANQIFFDRAKKAGFKALVWTVGSPGSPSRQRAARYGVGSANTQFIQNTWEKYHRFTNMTTLPIILKGIQSVEDVREAIKNKVPAVILSNHGGRNLDSSPSSLEVALEVYESDPSLFQQIEIWADGGVRYGSDVIKLLALGVRAVGLGRPFMFANVFGQLGIEHAVELLRDELMSDAANLGVSDLRNVTADSVKWTPNNWYS